MITDGIKEKELNFTKVQLIFLYLKRQYEIGYTFWPSTCTSSYNLLHHDKNNSILVMITLQLTMEVNMLNVRKNSSLKLGQLASFALERSKVW